MAMEKIDINEFNELQWHDAVIKNIRIDRSRPGINDIIEFLITWFDGTQSRLCFKDIYWVDLNMNFGIVAPESILRAFSEGKENLIVHELYTKWNGMIDDVDLYYYEIETNSTRSKLRIIAETCWID
jgi:hypothetical protein